VPDKVKPSAQLQTLPFRTKLLLVRQVVHALFELQLVQPTMNVSQVRHTVMFRANPSLQTHELEPSAKLPVALVSHDVQTEVEVQVRQPTSTLAQVWQVFWFMTKPETQLVQAVVDVHVTQDERNVEQRTHARL
jgi:hypothetical protein